MEKEQKLSMKEKIKQLFNEYYNDETMPVIELEDNVLALFDVVGRSEQLKAFVDFAEFAKQEYGLHVPLNLMKEYVKSL